MRTITGDAGTKVTTQFGTEPITIIGVEWKSGQEIFYSDKVYGSAISKLISISNLQDSVKLTSNSISSDVNIVLDDTDGQIKTIMDSMNMQKIKCNIYQGYTDLAFSTKFLLYAGEVQIPITWDEKSRQVSFSVMQQIESREVGYSLEQDDYEYMAPESVDKAWPLCFGDCVRIPATKLISNTQAKCLTRYKIISPGELDSLQKMCEDYSTKRKEREEAELNMVPSLLVGLSTTAIEQLNTLRIEKLQREAEAYIKLFNYEEAVTTTSPDQATLLRTYINTYVDYYDTVQDITIAQEDLAIAQQVLLTYRQEYATLYAELQKAIRDQASADVIRALVTQVQNKETDIENANTDIQTFQEIIAHDGRYDLLETLSGYEEQLLRFTCTVILVENGYKFPQSVPISVILNGNRMKGQFVGDWFFIQEAMIPININVNFTTREDETPNRFWIENADLPMKGNYCFINHTETGRKFVVYVTDQQGSKCIFEPLVWRQYTKTTAQAEEANTPTVCYEQVLFNTDYEILEVNKCFLPSWKNYFAYDTTGIESGYSNLPDIESWGFDYGDEVYVEGFQFDWYIANIVSSTAVYEVCGMRTVDGVTIFTPIPSWYYSIDLSRSLNGMTVTSIIFQQPLSSYKGENWVDQIYVTLRSSLDPNVADVIQYIVENYTNLSVDTTTFAAVHDKVANYPAHFALLSRPDAMKAIEDIAWQARCAIIVKNQTVYLKYLSYEEDSVDTIDDSNSNDITITHSNDNLNTKFIATWKLSQAEQQQRRIVYRNNIPIYGLFRNNYDFTIYNIEELVAKSATFWHIRYSNIWKEISFRLPHTKVALEPLDTITLDYTDNPITGSGGGSVKAVILDWEYDFNTHEIRVRCWTPVRMGEVSAYSLAWPSSAAAGVEFPTSDDLYAGGEAYG